MQKIKILVTDEINKEELSLLEKNFQIDFKIGISEKELEKIIEKYEVIITRSQTAVPAKIIEKAKNLKIIARAAIGVDNIDIFAATKRKIAVINAPKGNARATAEHTIGLLISLLRHIPQACFDLKNGLWNKTKYVGTCFYGKTLGIVGFGNVGREVYRLAKGLGLKVVVCEPYVRMPRHVHHVTYEELLKISDIITFHVPATYLTKKMLNQATLKLCKEGVYLINCSRGAVLDEEAVIEYLEKGKIAGLALDVFNHEPHINRRLLKFPNVIATPHIAGSTFESQKQSIKEIINGIREYFNGKAPSNLLNPQVFQKTKQRKSKILDFDTVIFDCDSTLSAIEGIDELAAFYNLKEKIAVLTKKAMEGELPFEEVFHQRLQLIKPTRESLNKLGELYIQNLNPEAKEVIEALRYLKKKIYLISSGYTQAILTLGKYLGIDDKNIFANDLIFHPDGRFQSHVEGPLKRNHGKLQIIRQLPGKKVMIGDGITDLETKELVELFIGYGGVARRPIVEKESDVYLYCQSLSPILVLAAGINGCLKLLSTKYKKLVGKGMDYLAHGRHVRIGKRKFFPFDEFRKLAYYA